jgi:hypothetical protein
MLSIKGAATGVGGGICSPISITSALNFDLALLQGGYLSGGPSVSAARPAGRAKNIWEITGTGSAISIEARFWIEHKQGKH